jgi:hypothetical protein
MVILGNTKPRIAKRLHLEPITDRDVAATRKKLLPKELGLARLQ